MTENFLRPCPDVKSTNYMHAIWPEPAMRTMQAQDILYLHQERVVETTRSNFFIFSGGELVTPGRQVLAGHTRRAVRPRTRSRRSWD
jgi:branched-subunit amino acid aminotransferase/4-amino-4-deoxychorismate lyase